VTTFPGYALPGELIALREQIRRIVRDELLPIEQRIDPDAPEIPEEDYRRLAVKTKAAGLLRLGAPEEYGGGGLDTFAMLVLLEEMAQHRPADAAALSLFRLQSRGGGGRSPDGRRSRQAPRDIGVPLYQRQAIQRMLADAEVELRATRWLIGEGAWKADRGEDARVEASIAKLYSSEVLGGVIDKAVQIHGGYGVSKELPLERWYREARVRRIGEGPSEVHRMVIARSLFR